MGTSPPFMPYFLPHLWPPPPPLPFSYFKHVHSCIHTSVHLTFGTVQLAFTSPDLSTAAAENCCKQIGRLVVSSHIRPLLSVSLGGGMAGPASPHSV